MNIYSRRILFLLLLLFCLPAFLSAQPYYVAVNGSDEAEGDHPLTAYRTINYAIQSASEGDTILIMPGFYYENILINKSGITIKAFSSEDKPIITDTSNNTNGVIKWTNNADANPYNGNVLDGLIVVHDTTSSYHELRGIWVNGDYNEVKNCEVYNIQRTGIVVQGNYNTIEYNYVHHIAGTSTSDFGNNISLESYYNSVSHVRRNSEYNTVRYNTLTDNLTHFGVNIFPETADPLQPLMEGNRVYGNFIKNTGGGIYARYQQDLLIYNNVILNSVFRTAPLTTGGGITLDRITDDEGNIIDVHPIPLNAGTTKIYNNTIVGNSVHGIQSRETNTLIIYNNIFVDNYNHPNRKRGHIDFYFSSRTNISSSTSLDNNIYFGTSFWYFGKDNYYSNLTDIQTETNYDQLSSFADPQLNSTDYTISYRSPAKNKGKDLFNEGVTEDKFRNPRPYWNNDFDIGAYEISDAQLKLGVTGIDEDLVGDLEIVHSVNSYGTLYEYSEGNFQTDAEPDSTSFFKTFGNTESVKDNWRGFTYNWMYRNDSLAAADSNGKMGIGFYKISNNYDANAYFYLDARDAITSYSPNVYLRFVIDNQPHYEYYQENNVISIPSGSIIRIWDIQNEQPTPNFLPDYWTGALLAPSPMPDSVHPRIAWGPYTSFSPAGYRIYRETADDTTCTLQDSVGADVLEWSDPEFILGSSLNVIYTVKAYRYSSVGLLVESSPTDPVVIGTNGVYKTAGKEINYSYTLSQNFPNPFNPTTKIAFQLPSEQHVELNIYNILGQKVKSLLNEVMPAGSHEVEFKASGLTSGIYFYRLTFGRYTDVKKMQLIK